MNKSLSYEKSETLAAILFILPAFLLLAFFVFFPMLQAFIDSFYQINTLSTHIKVPVHFQNYLDLFSDKTFLRSLKNSFFFAVIVIPVQTCIALGLALLIKKGTKVSGIYRTIYFLPVIISFAVASTIFKLMYNKDYGLINILLTSFGFKPIAFLSDPNIAMYGVIILCIWKAMGFYMIVFLSGLNNIPSSLYEAANVDGANPFQCFFKITLPLLKRTTMFIIVITTIDALKIFVPVYITTSGGGPAGATETVVMYIYKTAFEKMALGYASAASFIFFIIVLVISIIQMKMFKVEIE